jgi:hypothetical protein
MGTRNNAPLTPKGREIMVRSVVDHGLSKAASARQFNTTPKTVAKWVERFEAGAVRDAHCGRAEPSGVGRLRGGRGFAKATPYRRADRRRGRRFSGDCQPHSQAPRPQPAFALQPAKPVRRHARAAPGEIVPIDMKKLGKFNMWVTSSPAIAPARATPGGRLAESASGDRRPVACSRWMRPARFLYVAR